MEQSKGQTQLLIPLTRTRVIMKSSPEVEFVAQDAVVTMSKAAEMFVADLVAKSFKPGMTELTYQDVAGLLHAHEELSFLSDVLPQKIKAKEWIEKYKSMM